MNRSIRMHRYGDHAVICVHEDGTATVNGHQISRFQFSPKKMGDLIPDNGTRAKLAKLAEAMLSDKPAIAAFGDDLNAIIDENWPGKEGD